MAILLSLASQSEDGYHFSHDSYFALAEPLPRSVYHIGDYITVLYLFTRHKGKNTTYMSPIYMASLLFSPVRLATTTDHPQDLSII